MYKSVLEELQNDSYSKVGTRSSIGTLQLGLRNREGFDEVYNVLPDEDSKSVFDWFTKYRVIGDLKNTYRVMMDTFCIGVWPGIDKEKIEYVKEFRGTMGRYEK